MPDTATGQRLGWQAQAFQAAGDLAEATQAADQLMALRAGYSEERGLANQLLGQVQMADAFAKFSLTVSGSKLAFVRENKLYRSLKGKKTADGQRFLTGT